MEGSFRSQGRGLATLNYIFILFIHHINVIFHIQWVVSNMDCNLPGAYISLLIYFPLTLDCAVNAFMIQEPLMI